MFGRFSRVIWLLVLGLAILFADFLTKAYAYYLLQPSGITVFQNFFGIDFSLLLTTNRGAAWGLFSNFQILLLIIRICVILGMLFYLFFMEHNRLMDLPLVLICSGAIGNVVDFFLYGYVVDFLYFKFWGYSFPLFNIADIMITVGIIALFGVTLFVKKQQKHASRQAD